MTLLANENIPRASILSLREFGYHVLSASETMAGASDQRVLDWSRKRNAVLLTMDRDYGEMIFKRGLPPPLGIVYLRLNLRDPAEAAELLHFLLANMGSALPGQFTTLTRNDIRQRPLP